jgi:ELWxxDGT repeat protein
LNQFASSYPANFVRLGSRVLFSTSPPTGGAALWSTDGTVNGTQHIIDIKASRPAPSHFVALNGKVLFDLTSDLGDEELWTTDGTASGTHLLTDSATGFAFALPGDRIAYHDRMIFAASAHVPGEFSYRGNAVWITDGTSSGTRLLAAVPYWGSDSHAVLFNDAVYFAVRGFLWRSDGTESGTVKVKAVSTKKIAVTAFGLFFMGFTEGVGWEPCVSDGTEAGTHPIGSTARADTQTTSDDTSYATAFGGRVLFIAQDSTTTHRKLWISDGTVAGTHIVHDLSLPFNSNWNPFFTAVGDRAFFATYTPSAGIELWKTDGTEAGTTMVRDINPGEGSSSPSGLVAVGDKVYFSAYDRDYTFNLPLWVSDGTSDGTHQVKGPYPRMLEDRITTLTNIDGILYFSGTDDVNGQEPWKSDGTAAGTSMIANLYPESGPPSVPFDLVAAGDWVYFKAYDGRNTSLWRSDGTSAGTVNLGLYPYFSVAIGRSLLFTYDVYDHVNGIYVRRSVYGTSDGTPEGTAYSDTLTRRLPLESSPSQILGDKLLISHGSLWAATIASDAPAVSLDVDDPSCVANLGGRLLFLNTTRTEIASDGGVEASELPHPYVDQWSVMTTDGTAEGTYEIARLGEPPASCPAVFKGNVFFLTKNDATSATKMWKTDGTFDGTTVVKSLPPASYTRLTAAGRNLFITIDGNVWVTDGTEGGTHLVGLASISLIPLGDRVVYPMFDAVHGVELWTSDGTVPGTHIVTDIFPGPESSNPTSLTNIGGLVYFQANDGLRGNEPWVTDGTAAGTRLVADIEPGPEGSMGRSWQGFPDTFVQGGNRIFFTATTRVFGRELWAMPLDAMPSLTIDDVHVTEGDGNDVLARFTVTLSSPVSSNVTVEFATENGTAAAGVDYDATSSTLAFIAGETTKFIDVDTRGNTVPENNKTFLLTLRNPTGAALAKTIAYALIEDDDQSADVALAPDFSNISTGEVSANASNNGPRAATAVTVTTTVTPSLPYNDCVSCAVPSLPSGTSATFSFGSPDTQRYFTATATARQRDTEPANNRAAWIANGSMAMDALYLTPGSQANVWFSVPASVSNITVASSDSAVIIVSTSFPTLGANRIATFLARGLRTGRATLMVFAGTTIIRSLDVDVVAAGTTPRWPGGIKLHRFNLVRASFDERALFSISVDGTAPYSGATATGLITLSSKGKELARVTLTPAITWADVKVYLPTVGENPITIDYAGDANFLPITVTPYSVTATIGIPSITVTSARTGSSVKIHVRAAGSPVAAPTGTLDITAPGTQIHAEATLVTTAAGVAEADVTVVDAGEKSHAVHVVYPGDAHYASATRDVQTVDLRHHAAGR